VRRERGQEVVGVLETIGAAIWQSSRRLKLLRALSLSARGIMSRSVQAMPLSTKLPIPMTKVGPGTQARPDQL
jgi:hypothetical protein